MSIDLRVSVNQLAFGEATSLEADLAELAEYGLGHVGLLDAKLARCGRSAGIEQVRAAGMRVSTVYRRAVFTLDDPRRWPAERASLTECVDAAAALDAASVYITVGPRGSLAWGAAVQALADAVAPVVEHAAGVGVPLCFETHNPLSVAVGFVHSLRDAVDLAAATGLALCVDIVACWSERDVLDTIASAVERVRLVQVGDVLPGTTSTRERCVPGDGVVNWAPALDTLLWLGYSGPIDVEVLGSCIDAEGVGAALRRGALAVTSVLGRPIHCPSEAFGLEAFGKVAHDD